MNASTRSMTVAEALLAGLYDLGVRDAFGLVGGAIAPFCDTLARSPLRSFQTRHEGGALFSAVEASLATDRPTLAFVTTGPGLLNALTGAMAARWEGARVIVISGATSPAQRGRWAVQESGPATLPAAVLYQPSNLFHQARLLDDPADLADALAELARGLTRPTGFVSHLALPIAVQRAAMPRPAAPHDGAPADVATSPDAADRRPPADVATGVSAISRPPSADRPPLDATADADATDADTAIVPNPRPPSATTLAAAALADGPFAVWVGWGARHAAEALRAFIDHTGAPVVCTPRGKGIFPESDPRFLGVTGCGGHDHVEATLAALGCRRMLVLGTRLGEFSSCWSSGLVPPDGLVHVDVDADAFGAAYPDAPTVRVQADVAALLDALRPLLPAGAAPTLPAPPPATAQAHRGPILPQTLLAHLQQAVVEGSNAPLIAESGNAFLWANSLLRFDVPGRYRVSGLWGSMGHATSGVLGLAAARGKAFALVGDGAMLMMNEVSTAVQYDLPAVWVILNDARMGIVEKGMQGLGLRPFETDLPPTDFAALSRAMGADGVRVTDPADLPAALAAALAATGPFVVDVLIDPDEPSPFARRVSTLNAMGANSARSTP